VSASLAPTATLPWQDSASLLATRNPIAPSALENSSPRGAPAAGNPSPVSRKSQIIKLLLMN